MEVMECFNNQRVGGLDPGQKLLNMNMQERLYLKEDL